MQKRNSHFAKIFVMGAIVATACDVSDGDMQPPQKQSSAVRVDPSVGVAMLGYGYDSHSEEFTSECVNSATEPAVSYAGQQQSYIFFEQELDYEQLKFLLDVEVSGKFQFAVVNASGGLHFLTEAASSELSRSLVFGVVIKGKTAVLNSPVLNDRALDVAATANDDLIRAQCGDEFVNQIDLGSQLFINVKFEFANAEARSEFEAEIHLDFIKMFEVEGAAKVALEKFANSVKVSISAHQVGGNVQKLAKILGQDSSGGVAMINCSVDNVQACEAALNNIMTYVTKDYMEQIDDFEYNTTEPNGPAVLSYRTSSYYQAGLRELYPNPSPALKLEIVEARNRLLQKYEIQRKDRRRTTNLLSLRLTQDDLSRLMAVDSILASNIRKMIHVAEVCWDTPLKCVDEEADMQLDLYNPEDIYKDLVFYDYCIRNPQGERTEKTIQAIMDYLGSPADSTCLEIEDDLLNTLQLELNNHEIVDLRPLRHLDQLWYLDLSHNNINNLSTLSTLTNLRTLNLRHNKISNLAPLAGLTQLKSLDLAYNRMVDIEPLANLVNLKVLKLQGGDNSRIEDFSPVENLELTVFYPNLEGICEQERDWALEHGLVQEMMYATYKSIGFAPMYNVPQDRTTGINAWVNCEALESYY